MRKDDAYHIAERLVYSVVVFALYVGLMFVFTLVLIW